MFKNSFKHIFFGIFFEIVRTRSCCKSHWYDMFFDLQDMLCTTLNMENMEILTMLRYIWFINRIYSTLNIIVVRILLYETVIYTQPIQIIFWRYSNTYCIRVQTIYSPLTQTYFSSNESMPTSAIYTAYKLYQGRKFI